jgi:hypothetical protein
MKAICIRSFIDYPENFLCRLVGSDFVTMKVYEFEEDGIWLKGEFHGEKCFSTILWRFPESIFNQMFRIIEDKEEL